MNRSIDVVAAELEFGMRNAEFVMHSLKSAWKFKRHGRREAVCVRLE